MFFRNTKLILILMICLLSVFSVAQAKNYPVNLDRVDTEIHPWGGDDNFNPDEVYSDPDLAPPIIIGTKSYEGMFVGVWNFLVFKVERLYLDYTRSGVSSTTLHGSDGSTTGSSSTTGGE